MVTDTLLKKDFLEWDKQKSKYAVHLDNALVSHSPSAILRGGCLVQPSLRLDIPISLTAKIFLIRYKYKRHVARREDSGNNQRFFSPP